MTPDELTEEQEAQEHLDQRRRDIERERGQSGGFERIGDILDGAIPTRPVAKAVQKERPKSSDEEQKVPKNSGKAPSFQFYQNDWLSDMELQSCSFAAKGLFIDMLCHMRNSKRPGRLLLNGQRPSTNALHRVLSIHKQTFKKLSKELIEAGVLKQKDGVYYCARMVKDEGLREKDRERQRRKRAKNGQDVTHLSR